MVTGGRGWLEFEGDGGAYPSESNCRWIGDEEEDEELPREPGGFAVGAGEWETREWPVFLWAGFDTVCVCVWMVGTGFN